MKKIEDFNQVCPLLERMSDKAMMDRHWKRIEDITGHKFDVESEGFQLRHVMDAPLLEHLEDIEVRGSVTARCTHAAHIKQDGQHRGTPLSHTTCIHTHIRTHMRMSPVCARIARGYSANSHSMYSNVVWTCP